MTPEPLTGTATPAPSIPELVARAYEAAPAVDRVRLLEQLMRPLGVLSLFGVAGGVFANIRFRRGWPDLNLRLEDIEQVRSPQVMALAEHVQQVSVDAVDGLAQVLSASPVLATSAATALLVTLLLQRAAARQSAAGAP